MRTRSTLVIALAVLSFAASACDKKKDGGGKAKLGAEAQSTLAYFPANSTYAGSIKVAALQSSALWKTAWPLVSKMGGTASLVGDVESSCGMNPLTAVKEVHFGGSDDTPIALLKGMDRAKAKGCAQTMAEKRGRQLTITSDGQLDEIQTKRGSHFVQWLDDTTALAAPDKATLDARLAGGGGLDGSDGFLDMASKIDTDADLWFVTRDVKLPKGLPIKLDLDLQAAFMSMSVTNGLHIKGGLRLVSEAAAKETVKKLNSYLDSLKSSMIGSIAGGFTAKQSGPDVLVQLKLDTKQLDTLLAFAPMAMSMLKSKLGPLMGNMNLGGGDPDPMADPLNAGSGSGSAADPGSGSAADPGSGSAPAPGSGSAATPEAPSPPAAPAAPEAPVAPATGGKDEAGSAASGGR